MGGSHISIYIVIWMKILPKFRISIISDTKQAKFWIFFGPLMPNQRFKNMMGGSHISIHIVT